jgi:hypothetical protein
MLIQDDGRALLPEELAAGAEYPVQLLITPPKKKGSYICEIDLVHEGFSWFKNKGCRTVRFPVQVGSKGNSFSATVIGTAEAKPTVNDMLPYAITLAANELYADQAKETGDLEPFPMQGIPSERISEFFRAKGAEVLRMEEDEHGGPEWIGYRYVVKKNQSPRVARKRVSRQDVCSNAQP